MRGDSTEQPADAEVGSPPAVESRAARKDHRAHERLEDEAAGHLTPQRRVVPVVKGIAVFYQAPTKMGPPMKSGIRLSSRRMPAVAMA